MRHLDALSTTRPVVFPLWGKSMVYIAVCEAWNGLPGNCVPLDSNGHNTDCNGVRGYLLTNMWRKRTPLKCTHVIVIGTHVIVIGSLLRCCELIVQR